MTTLFAKADWKPGNWLAAGAMALLLVAGTAADAAPVIPPAPQGSGVAEPVTLALLGLALLVLAIAPPRRRRRD